MGILQKARLLSSNETCRLSERIAVFVGVSSIYTHPLKIHLPRKNLLLLLLAIRLWTMYNQKNFEG